MTSPEFRNEAGWTGIFTRNEAEGAIPNGTRIRKINSEPEDAHQDGAEGIILGSIKTPEDVLAEVGGIEYAYFIEWDDFRRTATGITGNRVEPV